MLSTLKESGFCQGVKQGIHTADAMLSAIQAGQSVYLFGNLVNNRHVMDRYKKNGYQVTTSIEDIPPGAHVIVRAHGLPKATIDTLAARQVNLVDCTCVKVKKIHRIVEDAPFVLVIGKKNHPETIGICGWCLNTIPIVIETAQDFTKIDFSTPLTVVGQTTCDPSFWQQATDYIIKQQPQATIHHTLCPVTTDKCQKVADLSQKMDAMVVVGDPDSANSVGLYQACKSQNPATYFVSSLADLMDTELPITSQMGLVASASTPDYMTDEVRNYLQFQIFFKKFKQDLDIHMEQVLGRIQQKRSHSPILAQALAELTHQHMGGKGIRGCMIGLGATFANSPNPTRPNPTHILEIATAYELFQTAILIHDDAIDRAHTRRGKATIHQKNQQDQLGKGVAPGAAKHHGISQAICIGDYGFFIANTLFAELDMPADVKIQLLQQFSHIQTTTLEGEILDILSPVDQINVAEDYSGYMGRVFEIYTYKTAWYTLVGPILLGAIAGGASPALLQQLEDITLPLGVAFQIKDDILGVYGDEVLLGKSNLSDAQEKKQTILYGYAYHHASDEERAQLDAMYGNPHVKSIQPLRDIFTNTGALAYAREALLKRSEQSLAAIERSSLPPHQQDMLRGLVSYLIMRGA